MVFIKNKLIHCVFRDFIEIIDKHLTVVKTIHKPGWCSRWIFAKNGDSLNIVLDDIHESIIYFDSVPTESFSEETFAEVKSKGTTLPLRYMLSKAITVCDDVFFIIYERSVYTKYVKFVQKSTGETLYNLQLFCKDEEKDIIEYDKGKLLIKTSKNVVHMFFGFQCEDPCGNAYGFLL